ncbi:MAG: exonuclease domain-containing protein [Candidatus Omnitrophica bacterium]|nr:exonuclease domain-containing protein [Candidatus Omnitrophota bacterium]
MKITRPLVVLDLETTGTWIEKDKIVEIALIKLHPDGRREDFKARVNPGVSIPPRVSEIIGIKDEDVKDCPPFREIAVKVLTFIGDADLGGFNVEGFDLRILERELFDAGLKFDWRTRTIYDAQRIYHLHEKRTLKAAYQFYCGKELVDAHTAMADADATVEILQAQIQKYGNPEEGVESLRNFRYERMDDYFDDERKFRWWNGELYPVFGKYAKRVSLKEIAKKDRSYLEWMLTTDFPEPVKVMLKGVLEGRFPAQPERTNGGESDR